MIVVELERFCYGPRGTFGRLTVGDFACYTCEPPWLHNARGRSCIPEGRYPLVPGRYNRGGYATWELRDVAGVPTPDGKPTWRSLIKIHRGNTIRDTRGCILLGKSLGVLGAQWAVTNSTGAHHDFMDAMAGADPAFIKISRNDAAGKVGA